MKINLIKSEIKSISAFLVATGLVIVLFACTIMAENTITVTAEIDKSVITIGDRVIYSLTITYDKQLNIQQPGPGANLGQFEIKDYTIHDAIEKDGMIQQEFDYEISVFDTGKFTIPPFPVAFSGSDTSQNYQIITSEPLNIHVESVLTAEDREIRDIKPPQNVPFDYRKWIFRGILAMLVLGLIAAVIYYVKFRKKGIPLFKKEVVRPAHEIALEELAVLLQNWQTLLEEGKQKSIFTDLSMLSRRYLENRFFIKALEETTTEIGQSINELDIEISDKEKLMEILNFSDLVKFAKYIPSEEETRSCLEAMHSFIQSTKIVFEPEEGSSEVSEPEKTEKRLEPEIKS